MGVFFSFAMNTAVVFLLGLLLAFASAQLTNGFDPPRALSNPSPEADASPESPASPASAVTYAIYSLSPIQADSPAPFSVITLPTAFSYGSGPFKPYTKISPGHVHNHISPIPSLSPFHHSLHGLHFLVPTVVLECFKYLLVF